MDSPLDDSDRVTMTEIVGTLGAKREVVRVASTLRDLGYAGTVSVEALSAELRELPVDDIARRIFATTAPYWR